MGFLRERDSLFRWRLASTATGSRVVGSASSAPAATKQCIAAIIALGGSDCGGSTSCPGGCCEWANAASVAASAANTAARCSRTASLIAPGAFLTSSLNSTVWFCARHARSVTKRERQSRRAAGCKQGCSPEKHTPIACMHTRTVPSESLAAAWSVLSHPRLPAFVERARMHNSPCDDLTQHLGDATRSYSAETSSKLLRLATLYSSGTGIIRSRTAASVVGRVPTRS